MADIKFPDDPRMQALHEACEAKAAADKERQDGLRLAETERRMITGRPFSTQESILSRMGALEKQFKLSTQELDRLVDDTERTMLGLPPPGSLNDIKLALDEEAASAVTVDRKKLRAFIVTRGRAPSVEELREMLRGRP